MTNRTFKYSKQDNRVWLDIPEPKQSDYGKGEKYGWSYQSKLAEWKCRENYPAEGNHNWEDGEVIEHVKHFKLEKRWIDAENNPSVVYTIGWIKVAIPITKEATEDKDFELYKDYYYWPKEWFEEVISYCRKKQITPLDLIHSHKSQNHL